MNNIAERLAEVRKKLAEAAQRSGRLSEEVSLVCVSKTYSEKKIQEAIDAGQLIFGESRIQEALSKAPLLPKDLHWHLIGHLQSNKIRKALTLFELFHSVDSVKLAQNIDRVAGEEGVCAHILLEVNMSGEASKFGFVPEDVMVGIDELTTLRNVQIEGLMTIAPFHLDPEHARPFFAGLRELRDRLASKSQKPFPTLSMGMSGDYEVAIEEGATLIRVGSSIFGERKNV